MSYLQYPRLHFSGKFQANPSTINNTPNNYNPNTFYLPQTAEQNAVTKANLDASTNPEQLQNVELFWNPKGNGVFNFIDCSVTKVVYADGSETTSAADDPIIGQSVAAVYSNTPPKIVDLDPMQQNVSEIWGLSVQVAGLNAAKPGSIADNIRGDFAGTAFNGIWLQAIEGPRSSASASAVYQAQLSDLVLSVSATPGSSNYSRFLHDVNAAKPDALSLNFVVNAHNNSPPIYSFNQCTMIALSKVAVPDDVLAKLQAMTTLIQNVGGTEGDVPTESFVNQLLSSLLTLSEYTQYQPIIITTTAQPYSADFNQFTVGDVNGTLGLSSSKAATYFVPSRLMTPQQNDISGNAFYAPFSVSLCNATSATITVNLGNSLITKLPGSVAYAEKLGALELVYFNLNAEGQPSLATAVSLASIDYVGVDFKTQDAGFFSVTIDQRALEPDCKIQDLCNKPLGIISTVKNSQKVLKEILLAENSDGYFMRADQFVYRMNPGVTTSPSQPMGNSATVNVHLLKFGKPAPGVAINLAMKGPQEAIDYTNSTMGTGGTLGIGSLSMPQSALHIASANVTTNADGIASFVLTASDPGNPRSYVDGQVYFLDYTFVDSRIRDNYLAAAAELVSIQVYQQVLNPLTSTPETIPTWDGEIRDILSQYGRLYPVMSRFALQSYESVVKNADAISTVLQKPIEDALHMPVTRDLSYDRLQQVLYWFENGMPRT